MSLGADENFWDGFCCCYPRGAGALLRARPRRVDATRAPAPSSSRDVRVVVVVVVVVVVTARRRASSVVAVLLHRLSSVREDATMATKPRRQRAARSIGAPRRRRRRRRRRGGRRARPGPRPRPRAAVRASPAEAAGAAAASSRRGPPRADARRAAPHRPDAPSLRSPSSRRATTSTRRIAYRRGRRGRAYRRRTVSARWRCCWGTSGGTTEGTR